MNHCASSLARVRSRLPTSLRWQSSHTLLASLRPYSTPATQSNPPNPPGVPTSNSSTIERIVDDISRLTLLEAADLVSLLKERLNIQEVAIPVAQAAAAPTAAVEEAPPEEEKPKEKTIFNVTIESFDPASKAKVIKEVKAQVSNLTLMEAKKFVESLPKVVKENLPKEEAEKLKASLEAIGAKVTLE